jgi:hypothetical protein
MAPLHRARRRSSGVRGVVNSARSGGQTYAGADYSADPILQQIRALAIRNEAAAQAQAGDSRRQALLSFGYVPGLDYGDAATAEAARQSPFSVVQQLARTHGQRVRSLDENLNKSNLYYSSYRGQQLGNEATAYLGEQAGAQEKLQGILGSISSGLAGARQTEAERVAQAEQDAYQRALERALKYGYGTAVPVRVKKKPKKGRR